MRLFDEIDRSKLGPTAPQQHHPDLGHRRTPPPSSPLPRNAPDLSPQMQPRSQAGSPLDELARQFNLPINDISQIIEMFIPAITNGMKRNVNRGGAEALIEALQRGQHDRYLQEPEQLGRPEVRRDGDSILGHIFGSKDISRELANRTSQRMGVDSSILKQMLPVVAQLTMGALRNQGDRAGMLDKSRAKESSVLDELMGMLDADGKDSPIDDLLGFLK